MGSEFSATEKKEYEIHGRKIDTAIKDNDQYMVFKSVRDSLKADLLANRRNIERYTVSYIKKVIKTQGLPEKSKFNALLLLKELLKIRHPALTNYNYKKFGSRLYALAASKDGPKCLRKYNQKADLNWSAEFHYLLLESWGHWGTELSGLNQHYLKSMNKLKKLKKLPVPNKYWESPHDLIEDNEDDLDQVRSLIDKISHQRIKVMSVLKDRGAQQLNDNELLAEINIYKQDRNELYSNSKVGELINGHVEQNAETRENVEEIQNEFLMFDTIYDNYFADKDGDMKIKQNFLKNVAETHNNIFHTAYDFSNTNENQPIRDVHVNEDYDFKTDERVKRQLMNSEDNEIDEQRVAKLDEYERPQIDQPLQEEERFNPMKQNIGSYGQKDRQYDFERIGKSNKTGQVNNNDDRNQKGLGRIEEENGFNDSFQKNNNQVQQKFDLNIVNSPKLKSNQQSYLPQDDKYQNGFNSKKIVRTVTEEDDNDYIKSHKSNNLKESKQNDFKKSEFEDNYNYEFSNKNKRLRNDISDRNNFESNINNRFVTQNSYDYDGKSKLKVENRMEREADMKTDGKDKNKAIRTNGESSKPFNGVPSTQSIYLTGGNTNRRSSIKEPINSSREFYRSYFADDKSTLKLRKSGVEGKFRTEGLDFVNNMYNNINHTIAPHAI